MNPLVVTFIIFLAACLGAFSISWHFSRSRRMLNDWAARNGFELMSCEYCWLWRGPFFFRSSKGQAVYRILVRDAQGRQRSGYARCGGWLWGLLTDQVNVRWDDER